MRDLAVFNLRPRMSSGDPSHLATSKTDKRPRTESEPLAQSSNATTRVPQLSNELIAHIIDFLEGDSQSLKHCALASHNFLHPARKFLHYHVFLNIRNCAKFSQTLDASPFLGSYVKQLHLFISNPMENEDSWVDRYLPIVAPKLSSVFHLELKGDKNGRYKAAAFQALQSIRRWSLYTTQIADMNELCAMFDMFPHLETFYAHDLFVFRSPEIVVKPNNLSPVFRQSSFNSCRLDPAQLADWIIQHGLFVHMEYFCVAPLQQVGLPPVGKMLHACGSTLRHFKLALVGMKSQGGFVAHKAVADLILNTCRLDHNIGLRVVEFGSPAQFANLYGSDDLDVSWFTAILSTITSKDIEEVVFNLWGGDTENPKETGDLEMIYDRNWGEVLEVLLTAPFHSLRRLTFHVAGVVENAVAISDAVMVRFRAFGDSGILHIDSKEDSDCR